MFFFDFFFVFLIVFQFDPKPAVNEMIYNIFPFLDVVTNQWAGNKYI